MQCVSCGGVLEYERHYVFKSAAFQRIYPENNVYRCRDCDLVQANASVIGNDELTGYYARHYRRTAKIAMADTAERQNHFNARGKALASLVKDHLCITPKTGFELGSGHGLNLRAFAEVFPGLQLSTDEIDPTYSPPKGVEKKTLSDGPFDIIILSHVLEHFIDPVGLLEQAQSALSPEGLIVIEVPNDVRGVVPLNVVDEPHLSFFTDETLMRLLAKIPGTQTVDVFAAGPSYRKRSLKSSIRDFAKVVLKRLPLVREAFDKKRGGRKLDYSRRNPEGVFLRAVLGK